MNCKPNKRKEKQINRDISLVYDLALLVSVVSFIFVLSITDYSITGFSIHDSISGKASSEYSELKTKRFDEISSLDLIKDFSKSTDIILKKSNFASGDVVKMAIVDESANIKKMNLILLKLCLYLLQTSK